MIKTFLSYVFILLPFVLSAQTTVGGINASTAGLNLNTAPMGIVQGVKLEEPKLTGNTYFEDEWNVGSIYLSYGHKVENYPLKYDLNNASVLLNIEAEGKVKSLNCGQIDSIQWFNSKVGENQKFINASHLAVGLSNSLVLVLTKGTKSPLVKNYSIKIVEGTYVAAIDMGERERKITKVEKYYFVLDQQFVEVPRSKKKLAKLFPDIEILPFIKTNKVNIKDEGGLIQLAEFLNSNPGNS